MAPSMMTQSIEVATAAHLAQTHPGGGAVYGRIHYNVYTTKSAESTPLHFVLHHEAIHEWV